MEKITKIILIIITVIIVLSTVIFLIQRYIPFGERAKFVGTWESENSYNIFTFYQDSTIKMEDKSFGIEFGTWSLKGGKLIVKYDGTTNTNEYYFFDNDQKFEIAGTTFIKQK